MKNEGFLIVKHEYKGGAEGLTKKAFSEALSKIINKTRLGCRVKGEDKQFVLQACKDSAKFSTIASDPTAFITVQNIKAGPRYVRMLVLHRIKPDKKTSRQVCPKNQLIDSLYPIKTTKRKNKDPYAAAKRYAAKVRIAMRLVVADQIREFRQSLEYPVFCERTRKKLQEWMKTDIDHINKPFLQLCDEFLRENSLYYSDLTLIGCPNAKEIENEGVSLAWQKFHKLHAVLAAVDSSANRGAGCGDYVSDFSLLQRPPQGKDKGLQVEGW